MLDVYLVLSATTGSSRYGLIEGSCEQVQLVRSKTVSH